MKQRCLNERCSAYKNYGGRGITICAQWMAFEPFLQWALDCGWEKGLDLDRIDNEKGYCPDNCRWTTRRNNVNNRRCTMVISVDGKQMPRTQWEENLQIPYGTIKSWVEKHGIEYATARIHEAITSGYIGHDYSRNHKRTMVKCIETGVVYPSMKNAAHNLGLNTGNIIRVCRCGGKTGGYHFEIVQ